MDLPNSGHDRAIRYLVPTHQRPAFGRALAALPPAFLGFPATGESFESKARLQGDGQTPLLRVAEKGYEAVVKLLLDTGKVEAEAKDARYGWTGRRARR